ncbi:PilZ domain-containing protein [Myxococcota bacterium]|nr:PilZ domain-containing protein [Myxococcota bacterium]MBU1899958.1 PilZ domain-containing protein [Myxococcota bacterium]
MPNPLTQEELEALLSGFDPMRPRRASEQRRFRRFDCALECAFEVDGRWHAGAVSSIGIGGVFLKTALGVPLGARLTLKLYLTSPGSQIRPKGEVIYVEPGGLGVRFEALSPDEIWRLIHDFHLSEEAI